MADVNLNYLENLMRMILGIVLAISLSANAEAGGWHSRKECLREEVIGTRGYKACVFDYYFQATRLYSGVSTGALLQGRWALTGFVGARVAAGIPAGFVVELGAGSSLWIHEETYKFIAHLRFGVFAEPYPGVLFVGGVSSWGTPFIGTSVPTIALFGGGLEIDLDKLTKVPYGVPSMLSLQAGRGFSSWYSVDSGGDPVDHAEDREGPTIAFALSWPIRGKW